MLRTGTDLSGAHTTLSLGPPGAHGKLFSDGRLGKPGMWTVCLPHCHVSRCTLDWPTWTGASELGSNLTAAERSRFSKRPHLGETLAMDLPMRMVCVSCPWADPRQDVSQAFLGQGRISGAGWGGVSLSSKMGVATPRDPDRSRRARIKYPTHKQSSFWSSMAGS